MTPTRKMLTVALGLVAAASAVGGTVQAQPRSYAETAYDAGYQDGRSDQRYREHRQDRHDDRRGDARWHGGADRAAYLFRALDRNNNGRVSYREFTRQYGQTRVVSNAFHRLDANRDGQLSTWEIRNGAGTLHRLG